MLKNSRIYLHSIHSYSKQRFVDNLVIQKEQSTHNEDKYFGRRFKQF